MDIPVLITKDKGFDLKKQRDGAPLNLVAIGLGWLARTSLGQDFDLDASALGVNSRTNRAHSIAFFNNLQSADGSLQHMGDDLTGNDDGEEGDSEVIIVDLSLVPKDVDKIIFPVTIYEAERYGQSFGQVREAYIRVVDQTNDTELARYNLSDNAYNETSVIFGELNRSGSGWEFKATEEPFSGGLAALFQKYKIPVLG